MSRLAGLIVPMITISLFVSACGSSEDELTGASTTVKPSASALPASTIARANGEWVATIPRNEFVENGPWRLRIDGGNITLRAPKGMPSTSAVEQTMRELRFAPIALCDTKVVGSYRYRVKLGGDRLVLDAKSDDCQRRTFLFSRAWRNNAA